MTTDNFIKAARAEAERRYIENDPDYPDRGTAIARAAAFAVGAEWGRDQALAQEPTDAEAGAVQKCLYERTLTWVPTIEVRVALSTARAARRNENQR